MTWIVQALERKDANGQPLGLFHLTANSDEGGGFVVGCDHDHGSADEASSCIVAIEAIGKATGFPVKELSNVANSLAGIGEAAIEAAIQAKGGSAPRLSPAHVNSQIVSADYYVFPGTTLTVCALTLRNGFIVTGDSRPADDANFDAAIGRQAAFASAREKIWSLEGYLLRERLGGGRG